MNRDSDEDFRSALETAVAGFGLDPLTEERGSQLMKHYAMLCRWNQKINLTRIIAAEPAAKHHYAESLYGAQFIAGERTILDIGSGAGFPAIPLAVARPDVQVTALESNHKKAIFLMEAKDELRLANLKIATARLEEIDWSGYDLLTSRALDRAESVFASVIERLSTRQRLLLYCAPDLIAKIEREVGPKCVIETHPLPDDTIRIIAIVTPRS